MKYNLKILRRKSQEDSPYWQTFELETDLAEATAATALTLLNQREPLLTADGHPARKILWDCSCLQKKCGACAMVICGRPQLACNVRLSEIKEKCITIEPLRKFPVIADLIVDRSILFRNLMTIESWLTEDTEASEDKDGILYEASRCLQCGCCLEICPNFYAGSSFFGMASMVPVSRLLEELPRDKKKELKKAYRKHVYSGCGKSLACRDICPAGIDMEKLLVNSNAVALWKWFF
ncbi:MAG: 4Fe-4S dicluster domain-containing protein [Eubacterium sp.]|nr:4Fe-4S dicluster domain-containing protein [Eubacterium sp.]